MNELSDLPAALAGAVRDAAGAWRFIRDFAAWTGRPLVDGDGIGDDDLRETEGRLGFALPAALREMYALIGRRADLTQGQDRLLRPDQLHLDPLGRVLVFRWENQRCAEWGIPLTAIGQADPPVVVGPGENPFLDRVSLAAVEMVMSETMWSHYPFGAYTELDDITLARLESSFRRLPLPDYPLWTGAWATKWFHGFGAVLRADADTSLWVRAMSADAVDTVRQQLPGDWAVEHW